MNKLLIIFLIIALCISAFFFVKTFYKKSVDTESEKQPYQGPVRPTDNESYFRETGKTKPLGVSNGNS